MPTQTICTTVCETPESAHCTEGAEARQHLNDNPVSTIHRSGDDPIRYSPESLKMSRDVQSSAPNLAPPPLETPGMSQSWKLDIP